MGGEWQHQPQGAKALAAEIKKLKRDVDNLSKSLRALGLQIDPDTGSLVVGSGRGIRVEGGLILIVDSDGNPIVAAGTGPTGNTGIQAQRADGTPSFWATTQSDGFAALFDRAGNYVFTDDTTSGQGIARPYLNLGAFVSNTPPTDTTTSSSFTTLQTLVGYKQHPKVSMQVLVQAISPGEVRVIDQAGNQIGNTEVFGANDFRYITIQGALAGAHMLPISLNLQARTTSGTDTIGVRGVSAIAVESAAF